MDKRKLYLIDASSFIWRAFYGLPLLTNSKGAYVNAITGFGTMIVSFLTSKKIIENGDKVLIIFDADRNNFRHEIYPEYKGNRKEPPKEIVPQFAIIKDMVKAFDLPSLEILGVEADDLIASYAKKAKETGQDVVIISSDKDLMQLINGHIKMYDPMKDKSYEIEDVIEKFGVTPDQVVTYQAITGDASDNIPGIPGLGPKAAQSLIQEYSTLDNIFANIDKITPISKREKIINGKESALISYRLAMLKNDIDLPIKIDSIEEIHFNEENVIKFCEVYGLNKVKTTVLKLMNTKSRQTNIIYKSNRYDKDIKEIINFKKVHIYPFFDNKKIFEKGLSGLSICDDVSSYFIPLKKLGQKDLFAGDDDNFNDELNKESIKIFLKSLFEDNSIQKIIYDTKTLFHALSNEYNITINNYEDVHTLLFSVFGLSKGIDFETSALNITQRTIEKQYSDNKKDFENLSQNSATVKNVYDFIIDKISNNPEQEKLYKVVDKPLIEILFKMEQQGIFFNKETLNDLKSDFSKSLSLLQDEIYKLSGEEFNIASPKQLGEVLFEKMKLPYSGKKKDNYETGVKQLSLLSEQGYKIADLLLDYRALSKLISTYTQTLIDEISPSDKRIHTTFLQNNVNTGRLASVNPNLQNIPIKTELGKSIRKAFVSKEGYSLISCDYSQIELRIMAHIANVKNLITAFDNNEDIHTSTAKKIFKKDEVGPTERRFAKTINFGIIYGMSSFGLSQSLNISREDAKEFIDKYFEIYPEILTYMKSKQEEAKNNGYVETLFHRRCFFGTGSNEGLNYVNRAAINAPIQGTAADLLRMVMNKLPSKLEEKGLSAKLLLQIHDELVLEVKDEEIEATKEVLKEVMENIVTLAVPLKIDSSSGKTLYDIH